MAEQQDFRLSCKKKNVKRGSISASQELMDVSGDSRMGGADPPRISAARGGVGMLELGLTPEELLGALERILISSMGVLRSTEYF